MEWSCKEKEYEKVTERNRERRTLIYVVKKDGSNNDCFSCEGFWPLLVYCNNSWLKTTDVND